MSLTRTTAAALAAAACALALPASALGVETQGLGENIEHVKNIPYPDTHVPERRNTVNAGTDIEFAKIAGRQYAFAGSYGDGVHIVDISDPESATRVATWDCGMSQADPQVFQRDDMPGRWFVTSTMDDGYVFFKDSQCVADLARRGVTVPDDGYGTFIAEVTNPRRPRTVGFIPFKVDDPAGFSEGASHNGTVHPSGRYFYNSDSDLINSVLNEPPAIEVFDMKDFARPKLVDKIPLKVFPGLGTESHDITFNADGTRAYTAALSHGAVIDTTDPENNKNIGTIVDPAINVWHQADPVTITDPILGKRTFLVAEDEVAGALGTGQCPNGGVHVYDITGDLERTPVKVGYWNIDEARLAVDGSRIGTSTALTCTAHVFDIHEDEAIMTIAYYNGGVRVVDLSGLVGVALGKTGIGMKQLGFFRFEDSDTWAVKAPFVSRDGFYLYGNDQNRAFDVYRYQPTQARLTKTRDSWMSPAEQRLLAERRRAELGAPELAAVCLLRAPGKQAQLEQATVDAGLTYTGRALGSL